jgi:hypothetical protein
MAACLSLTLSDAIASRALTDGCGCRTSLDRNGRSLRGTIPESIGNLTALTYVTVCSARTLSCRLLSSCTCASAHNFACRQRCGGTVRENSNTESEGNGAHRAAVCCVGLALCCCVVFCPVCLISCHWHDGHWLSLTHICAVCFIDTGWLL